MYEDLNRPSATSDGHRHTDLPNFGIDWFLLVQTSCKTLTGKRQGFGEYAFIFYFCEANTVNVVNPITVPCPKLHCSRLARIKDIPNYLPPIPAFSWDMQGVFYLLQRMWCLLLPRRSLLQACYLVTIVSATWNFKVSVHRWMGFLHNQLYATWCSRTPLYSSCGKKKICSSGTPINQ